MKHFLTFLIIISSITLNAQHGYSSETYAISKPDLSINTFKKDSTANALVLYEYGNSFVNKNTYKINFEFKQKLKIINEKGFDKATIKIYLYKSDDAEVKIKKLKATTYNLVNNELKKTELESEHVYTKNLNKNYDEVTFTFPNIKAGSVLTYSYMLIDPFPYKFIPWEFQADIPKLYSEYNTSIPGNYLYHIKLVGERDLAVNKSEMERNCLKHGSGSRADCYVSKYIMKDIPALIEEDYMTDLDNFKSRIEYELNTFKGFDGTINYYTKTWETVDKELKVDFNIGKQLRKLNLSKLVLADSIISIADSTKKAKAIFNFVKKNYKWDGKHNLFKETSVKNLIRDGTGSAAEINILLHNLLKENEFNVSPVLLSTRNNGFATRVFPVISDFNYLIPQVKISEKTYFLDATSSYHFFGEIPFKCLNQYGRLLDFKNASSWVNINPINNSSINYFSELDLKENKMTGEIKSRYLNYKALQKKQSYYTNTSDYLDPIKNNTKKYEVHHISVKSSNINSNKFEDRKEITINDLELIDNKIYFNPFIETFFNQNPFKLQNRTYPIDFGYNDSFNYYLSLTLDESHKLIDYPKNEVIKFSDNSAGVSFSISEVNNKILVNFKLYFKEAIYSPENYQAIKNLFSKVIDIQKNTLLVIEKIR